MKTDSDKNDKPEAAVFEAALACATPQERAACLDKTCAGQPELRQRVEALLAAHDQATSFLENRQAASARPTIRLTLPEEQVGERIGRYKLLQKIGEGGCGVVYMAEQEEPVRRRVALKVIKLGMDTKQVVARFEAERQALALMDHPNIAKVLDAGATDQGRPFFVMELVKGIPVTRYCDENKLNTRQRLDLFIQICQAVQHAHQKGIIHRDLKPSNVLVADHDGTPVPKVIDFGIAKATTDQRLTDKTLFTAFEQFIGTPAYMSPEQAKLSGLDIDTRSDIYSLGVLLYELLTGKTPFDARRLLDAGFDEIRRIIREEEPVKPSTRLTQSQVTDGGEKSAIRNRQSAIASDLDWIVMKCLEKDRTRRYETANGLAADVQRHMSNEPVVACPPSAAYRFQKMVRRNKAAFAIATSVVSLVVIGLSVSTWLIRGKNAALERALVAERIQLKASRQIEAQRLLEIAGIESGKIFVGDNGPYTLSSLDRRERVLQNSATANDGGEATLRKALTLQKELMGADSAEVADTSEWLAAVLAYDPTNTVSTDTRLLEARVLVNDALRIKRKVYGNDSIEVADALRRMASAPYDRPVVIATSNNERILLLQESYTIQKKQIGASDVTYFMEILNTHSDLVSLLKAEGRFSEYEAIMRDFINTLTTGKINDWYVELRQVQLAQFLLAQKRVAEAETTLARFNYETNFNAAFAGDKSFSLRDLVNTKIEIYTALQKTNEIALWKDGLQKLDELEKKTSLELAEARAESAEKAQRKAQAESEAHELMRQVSEYWNDYPDGSGDVAVHERAVSTCQKALALRREIHGSNHIDVATSLDVYARLLTCLGATHGGEAASAAIAAWTESYSIKRRLLTGVALAGAITSQVKVETDKLTRIALLREAIELQQSETNQPWLAYQTTQWLADELNKAGQFSESADLYRKLVATYQPPIRAGKTKEYWFGYLGEIKMELAGVLLRQGKTNEAQTICREMDGVLNAPDFDQSFMAATNYYYPGVAGYGSKEAFLNGVANFYGKLGRLEDKARCLEAARKAGEMDDTGLKARADAAEKAQRKAQEAAEMVEAYAYALREWPNVMSYGSSTAFPAEAEKTELCLRRYIALSKSANSCSNETYLDVIRRLAEFLEERRIKDQGVKSEIKTLCIEAIALGKALAIKPDEKRAHDLSRFARYCDSTSESEAARREAISIWKLEYEDPENTVLGPYKHVQSEMISLGIFLEQQNRLQEALLVYEEIVEIVSKRFYDPKAKAEAVKNVERVRAVLASGRHNEDSKK